MIVNLDLKPDTEAELLRQADAAGLPIEQFLSGRLEAFARGMQNPPSDADVTLDFETERKLTLVPRS